MNELKVGDIVARKKYGGDVYFKITDIIPQKSGTPIYYLKGVIHRLQADSKGDDLVKPDPATVLAKVRQSTQMAKGTSSSRGYPFGLPIMPICFKNRGKPGRILHIDGASEFLDRCLDYYKSAKIPVYGEALEVSEQPRYINQLLEKYKPDILVVTGHDGIKKSSGGLDDLDSYYNSKYYVESVKVARNYQADSSRLFIFAGACQSCFEKIMGAGADFASAPGRVFIADLDPPIVARKIALTDRKIIVKPPEIIKLTKSGKDGIGGNPSQGHCIY